MPTRTPETNIDLYTAGTPNGHKINILLEELGLNYTVHAIDISKNVQKEPWFLAINPNGRIPAIVDNTPSSSSSGSGTRVFEGGAIMLYLTEKYDPDHKMSFAYNTPLYWESVQWLVWMQSGLGPMQGQANHFFRYAPRKIEYAVHRYQTETRRLYQVLEDRLRGEEEGGRGCWLVGGRYSVADLACFSWVNWAEWPGVGLEGFEKVGQWVRVIGEREATKRGVDIPEKFEMKEKMKSKEGEEEYARYHSNWVMQGQERDQERHK